ncbi:hypothetical protein F4782DRAFT_294200 [Xylaria castorea]|nr:hypothetical protein F4782DRAFT_294200 [Xylaria castorea]
MTSEPTTFPATAATAAIEEPGQFTLQILSPSVNVPQPLFLTLPVTTTVHQLKERIRGCVGTKPPNDAQRLIHRGRLLARDSETMLELFGEEPLRSTDRQTLHLVLRDLSEEQRPTPPLPSHQHAGSRAQPYGHQHPHQHAQAHPHPHQHQHQHVHQHAQHHPQHHAQYLRFSQHPNIAFGNPQAPGALNGTQLPAGMTPQQLLQNQFQVMARLGLANQPENPIFNSMGHQGMQTRGGPGTTTPGRTASPFQPESTRTVIREGVGPDGQRWRFTVNESIVNTAQRPGRTSSPLSSAEPPTRSISQPRSVPTAGSAGAHDLQNIFRTSDADAATRTMADAMRRNASSSSPANLASYQSQQPIPPGVTTPLIPSRNGSAAGTPDPLQALGRPTNTSAGIHANQSSLAIPEVYILSSPSGPRAILLNGSLGTYYSPQLRSYQPIGLPPLPTSFNATAGNAPHIRHEALPQIISRSSVTRRNGLNPNSNNSAPGQQAQLQPQRELQVPVPIQAQFGHGMDNPQIHAIRMVQIWPHIWMIIRLALFIWWFTSPTSSWSRWITVVSIAVTLFIVNTGVLNPFAEQIWIPLRRHLENLIPLAADVQGRQQQRPAAGNAQGGDANVANPARLRHPDPADAAMRLVQQRHQGNANWLLNQARRLERAGILFIASLAPGLAERHIAQVEAEAHAERQRQQEAEATAATAAEAALEHAGDNPAVDSSEDRGSPSDGDSPDYEAGPSDSTTGQNAKTAAPVDTHAT